MQREHVPALVVSLQARAILLSKHRAGQTVSGLVVKLRAWPFSMKSMELIG